MDDYPIVPGRGLNSSEARKNRLEFLKTQGIDIPLLADSRLEESDIQHNVESYIGSIEIPLGLAGPLLFKEGTENNYVYAPVGTLEGALVASMNRGAKVLSKCGGFSAVVLQQKMIRSPMFIFRNLEECVIFKGWVEVHFDQIKAVAEQYSNHARLIALNPFIAGRSVHLKFVYTTGDASGQNMTTNCTSHACNWIMEQCKQGDALEPVQYVIEGNAASDKKLSHFSVQHGRGIHVIAACTLKEPEINRVLRVKSEDLLCALNQSQIMSRLDGMIGYNINITNAIAAIFVATGQDLASIHESGIGILNLEKTEDGLYCTLQIPCLVIGTVGGGTQLPGQKQALQMMGCAGTGKVQRFAAIIAGFALALELSTFAAIVGGQFAKVHEKLGRNKPVNWLVKGEIDRSFLLQHLQPKRAVDLLSVRFLEKDLVDNGLIINLTSRVNRKLTGFVPLELCFKNAMGTPICEAVLLKSKPLDKEVFQGLHYMAASIDPALADELIAYREVLEFRDCHVKEHVLYRLLDKLEVRSIPAFYGSYVDHKREIYTLAIELLQENKLDVFNAENKPECWHEHHIRVVIKTIDDIHQAFSRIKTGDIPPEIKVFEPWKAKPLYAKFAAILCLEYEEVAWHDLPKQLFVFLDELESLHGEISLSKTIIHNDFNARNIAIRKGGQVCIYDWELAVYNFPHRDIVEFLSFALPLDFEAESFLEYLKYHYSLQDTTTDWQHWKSAYVYALKEYLVTRVTFYMTGKILMNYAFAERIFLNAFRMIDILSAD